MLDPFVITLSSQTPLQSVPACSLHEIESWWTDRVPLHLEPDALPLLDQWDAELLGSMPPSFPGWKPEGPGRTPVEAAPLIAFLRHHAEAGTPFTFNALFREHQGGREYPFFIDTYTGKLTISNRAYAKAKDHTSRLMLSAIRRDVRALLRLPQGWTLITGDFKSCHGYLALAVTGDPDLARDLQGDFHQVTGDRMVHPDVEKAKRRDFGKLVNNSMLFGLSARGLQRHAVEFLNHDPGIESASSSWDAWWARYPYLRAFREWVQDLVHQAQVEGRPLEVVSPSGRKSRFSKVEVLGKVAKGSGRREKGPDGAWRTIFSTIFRAVEGDLLQRTLAHFCAGHAGHGGKPVLPLYDALMVAAPLGREQAVWKALEAAGALAAGEIGVVGLGLEEK
ncbi:MAG: hypothetical protein JRI25_15340 [Deltaproteobacteria bacterium]|nr:hypothetical protein [Deltaproteobacteria bacterium]